MGLVRRAAWVAVVLAAPAGAAEERSPSPSTTQRAVGVVVRTVQLDSLSGAMESFSLLAGVRLRDAQGRRCEVPIDDVVDVIVNPFDARPDEGVELRLVNGDQVRGTVIGGDSRAVRIAVEGLGPVAVRLDQIVALVGPGRAWSIGEGQGNEGADVLWLANGDVVRGSVEAIGPEAVQVKTDLGSLSVKLDVLVQAWLGKRAGREPSEHESQALVQRRARLVLRGGSQATVARFDWQEQTATAELAWGETVSIDAGWIERVEVLGGRWQWLGELEPVEYEHRAFAGLAWGWRRDVNVLGEAMRLSGQVLRRGVGVHGWSRLVYRLDGRYEQFVSRIGIDDDSGPYADVTVEVIVDGQRRFYAEGVRRAQQHPWVQVPVGGAHTLELVVGFGQNGDVQDRLDWAEAALIRPREGRPQGPEAGQ